MEETMKAIRISSYGDADMLKLTDTEPKPTPATGQVLVRIHTAGVNFVDIYQRRFASGQRSETEINGH